MNLLGDIIMGIERIVTTRYIHVMVYYIVL